MLYAVGGFPSARRELAGAAGRPAESGPMHHHVCASLANAKILGNPRVDAIILRSLQPRAQRTTIRKGYPNRPWFPTTRGPVDFDRGFSATICFEGLVRCKAASELGQQACGGRSSMLCPEKENRSCSVFVTAVECKVDLLQFSQAEFFLPSVASSTFMCVRACACVRSPSFQ